jgi:hypothetical protein
LSVTFSVLGTLVIYLSWSFDSLASLQSFNTPFLSRKHDFLACPAGIISCLLSRELFSFIFTSYIICAHWEMNMKIKALSSVISWHMEVTLNKCN